MEWLTAVEFSYNNKKHAATGQTLFELNFGRYPWKDNLMVQMKFSKLEEFLIGLERSWEKAMKAMEVAQKTIKKQFDRK